MFITAPGSRADQFAMSASFGHATFLPTVLDILDLRSDEQVTWVDAKRVVAAMENIKTFWDRADMQFIRGTVSTNVARLGAASCNEAVTPPARRGRP